VIIDEHRHIGNCAARGNPTMADILCELDKLGVDCAVIASGSHPVDEPVSRQDEYASTMDCYRVAERPGGRDQGARPYRAGAGPGRDRGHRAMRRPGGSGLI